ncbi:PREDICTED: probable ATP-dependent RNA helicase DDX52 [Priapulus caudatus]|uniref:Probable ATP-dependent RNA helicase DDX52 n=1 Tax=Priapulus caudatus TaxID=37621 RepID=A0ABM1EAE9_PRICU|nr:PREDICTED: probable ATP-dependent RNA helicase DDX52 [Priapulus caudatus]
MTSTTMASSRSSRVKKSGRRVADRVTQIHREEVNALRNRHKIHVQGTDLPEPVESFSQLQTEYQLLPQLVENIVAVGYVDPTPIQMQAVTVMMHRRELLACAPTGSGKTAAFILPALTHLKKPGRMGFRVVVVSPTRELAKQTYREFQRLATGTGFHICMIGKSDVAKQKFGPKSPQKFDILVTTPNRLIHLLQLTPPGVSMKNVEWLIVDECDKLFEAGKQGFRDQLAVIYKACDSSHVRRAMFSATYTYEVEQWCKLNLDNVVTICVGGRNSATMSVKQELLYVGAESGKMVAMRELVKKGFSPPVLVFVQSKERAQDLYSELAYDGINVNVIHSDKTQLQRDNIVRDFRSGKIWMLICTELMGRGMDFKGVNLVINYDFPPSAISYIHRIGRTGRAGRSGEAVTFFTDEDLVNLRSIAAVMRQTGCDVPGYMLRLRKASKKVRRKLEKHAPKRESISTGKKKKAPFKRNEEGKKQGAVSDMVDRPSAASKIQTGAPKKKSKKTNLKKKKKMKPKKSQPSGGAVKKH